MRILAAKLALVGLVFSLVVSPTTAHAAKGVKKVNVNAGNGHRTYTGTVLAIHPVKSGYGTFSMRASHHHKKLGGAANGQTNTFNVTNTTKFEHHYGSAVNAVGPTALQRGQHIRVRASGNHSDIIQIMTRPRSRGMFTRHRSYYYHPHLYHRYAHHYYHHRRR